MTSPYIERAAQRAAQIPSKQSYICSGWDHDEKMIRFQRQSALYLPLEKSAPVRGQWKDWLAGAFLLFFMVTVIVLSLAV
jgi:hypothetical protein